MHYLIRYITRKTGEVLEYHDTQVEEEVITIGKGTDQIIHLPDKDIAIEHACLRVQHGRLQIKALTVSGVIVNGRLQTTAYLDVGDVVQIGADLFEVIKTPAGIDWAITVEIGKRAAQEELEAHHRVKLAQTYLSKRLWAWSLFITFLLLGIGIPAASIWNATTAKLVKSAPLPDDSFWDSGPLHAAHRFMGDQCDSCHQAAFTRVQDQQCIACHQSVLHHVDTTVHKVTQLEDSRCATCHKEHNEPSSLIRQDQAMCVGCHSDLSRVTTARTELEKVTEFATDHPEFKASLLIPTATNTAWAVKRESLSDLAIKENSQLNFSHQQHLDPAGMESPVGIQLLSCSDCHEPNVDGKAMQPIRMEQHCSSCHTLTFDESQPEREVPHGDPAMVMQTLEEYYSKKFLEDALVKKIAMGERDARRPGNKLSKIERDRINLSARQKTDTVARTLFERQVCVTCHEVTQINDAKPRPQWYITPVKLVEAWLPKAKFSHRSHQTTECVDCHEADHSTETSDVLIPRIENCRSCHGKATATEKVASTCIMCHDFHLEGQELLRKSSN